MNLLCCNEKPKWVENVRDKGYWFCDTCRKEVAEVTHPALEILDEDARKRVAWNPFINGVGMPQTLFKCPHPDPIPFISSGNPCFACDICGIRWYA